MTDERLGELLRTALPQSSPDDPSRDLWPDLVARIDGAPRWSLLDWSLAAAVAVSVLIFPEWLWLLAYHL